MIEFPKHECGLYLTHNQHKDVYETVEQEILSRPEWYDEDGWATPTSKQRAIENNELWTLQWYPSTPIGFTVVFGATLQEVLDKANK